MNAIRKNTKHLLAGAVFGISLMMLSGAVAWAAPGTPNSEVKQDWAKQRQEWFKRYTDRLADRLEIKASQQGAWQAYVKTLETVAERPAKKPEMKSDAASVARLHADMAALRAQKLMQIADATAKLQEVLSPDQRKTLDQIAAHAGHHGEHRFHGGEHEGHMEHRDGQWNHQKPGDGFDGGRDHAQH